MKRKAFQITLIDDVVLSARGGTVSKHETLDHIPGQVLLGLAASRLYQSVGAEKAFVAFHSGKVRFLNGLPLHSVHGPGYPMPFSWHDEKDGGSGFYNLAVTRAPKNIQLTQRRGGYVPVSCSCFMIPKTARRTKTSINPETGRVHEGRLFSYETIVSGQTFVMAIEADDDVDDLLWGQILDVFQGELRIGRSRSAEFGRVEVSSLDHIPEGYAQSQENKVSGDVILHLLSDMALYDAFGQPTLTPSCDHFGLSGGELDWSKSSIRARAYGQVKCV